MKKITLLMLSLLLTVGAMAQTFTTVADGVYTISGDEGSTRGNMSAGEGYADYPVLSKITYSGCTGNSVTPIENGEYWYVLYENGTYLYNIGLKKFLANVSGNINFSDTPYAWSIVENGSYTSIYDKTNSKYLSMGCGRTAANRPIAWDTNKDDGGAKHTFTRVEGDFSVAFDISAAKEAAIAELNNLAEVSVIYPETTEAVANINKVTVADNTIAGLNAAIEAVNKIVADYKTAAYKALSGKYYTINTPARGNGYLQMTTSKVVGTAAATTPANIWQFVENNGAVNIYNPYTGLYMCATAGNSAAVNVTDNQENSGAYTFTINNTNPANENAKVKIGVNGANVHVDGSSNLVRWDNGGASEFTVTLVEDFSTIISNYKTSTLATLDQWATLSVVFDASLIASAKDAIGNINTNSYATFAAIDAEIKKVTDAVAAKMFTFQTLATDNHRENVWVSANASTGKAIGLHGEHNYNSIWSLRHAGGVSFYMFNELNQVYMGAPSANCPLTETPSVAYTFEIIDAANGVVEMKCNGETMHASNHNDDKLLNWDGDEDASRWYIRTIDVAADIQTILDDLTETDYAEVPALGQYTTAAYNALVAARTSAKTVEEVEAAIAAFKKAKNSPVFTIDGEISYAKGKSVYDDNDGAPNFKVTNKYDKTMWWVFDQTATTVGVTESVNVVNYATRNGFWGAEALKITETSDANAEDGIFLFYTVGNGTPLHFQDANQVIVRYNSPESNSGSATRFTYLGNTYDLDKLTDEKIAALAGLQAAYNSKALYANAVIGEGLGQYKGDKDAIVTVLAAAEVIASKTLAQQATLNIADINAATEALNNVAALVINMPAAGKYYRIQGACEASPANHYITGHTNTDGGRIALTAEADASTIYYFDGTNLIAYQSGLVIGLYSSHWTFASIDDNSHLASTIAFEASPRTVGAYLVKSADVYMHYKTHEGAAEIDRCSSDAGHVNHDWYLTEVTELPVTVTSAGYATFFAPVAVTVPSGVTAHTVTINDEWASLSKEALTVIPAETGVVLVGDEGSYNFAVTTTAAAFEGTNLMAGTVAKTLVTKPENTECYVLAKPEGAEVAAMYVAAIGTDDPDTDENEANTAKFYNAGHKAYLAVEGGNNVSFYGFRFDEEENTTAIEKVETVTENVIFDLAGRRVSEITEKGIYIVNGKKVIK